jgi:hypothetical protein
VQKKDDPTDGSIRWIEWNNSAHIDLAQPINASGVRAAGKWKAQYTFQNGTLSLTAPVNAETHPPIPEPTPAPPEPGAMITQLVIDTWGTSSLTQPLAWAGPAQGTVLVDFPRGGTSNSGPVGGVNGP